MEPEELKPIFYDDTLGTTRWAQRIQQQIRQNERKRQQIEQLLLVFYDTIEPLNPNINTIYDGSVDTWCSDKFLFPDKTGLPVTMILASHVDCFRPYILVSVGRAFDDTNFTIFDLDTLYTLGTEGTGNKRLKSKWVRWIRDNRINLINCWLQQNTIIPLVKDYKFEHFEYFKFVDLYL